MAMTAEDTAATPSSSSSACASKTEGEHFDQVLRCFADMLRASAALSRSTPCVMALRTRAGERDREIAALKEEVAHYNREGVVKTIDGEQDCEIRVLKAEVACLRREAASHEAMKTLAEQRDCELAALKAEISHLNREAASHALIKARSEERDLELSGLKAEVAQLRREALSQEALQTQAEERDREVAALKAEVAALRFSSGELTALKTEVVHLRREAASQEAVRKMAGERDRELAALMAEIAHLRREAASKEAVRTMAGDWDRKLVTLRAEIANLRRDVPSQEALSARKQPYAEVSLPGRPEELGGDALDMAVAGRSPRETREEVAQGIRDFLGKVVPTEMPALSSQVESSWASRRMPASHPTPYSLRAQAEAASASRALPPSAEMESDKNKEQEPKDDEEVEGFSAAEARKRWLQRLAERSEAHAANEASIKELERKANERKEAERREAERREEAEREARERIDHRENETRARHEQSLKCKEEAERQAREEAARKAKEEAEREEAEHNAKAREGEELNGKAIEDGLGSFSARLWNERLKAGQETTRRRPWYKQEAEREVRRQAESNAREDAELKAREETKRTAKKVFRSPGSDVSEPEDETSLGHSLTVLGNSLAVQELREEIKQSGRMEDTQAYLLSRLVELVSTPASPLEVGRILGQLRPNAKVMEETVSSLLHNGWSLLHLCASVGSVEIKAHGVSQIVELLAARKWDPSRRNNSGETPLFVAVRENAALCVVHSLLTCRASANIKDQKGMTPLLLALHEEATPKAVTTVTTLLDFRADPNMKDDHGEMPLFVAVRAKSLLYANLLVRAGADPNAVDDYSYGETAFEEAAGTGDRALTEMLIQARANVNQQTKPQLMATELAQTSVSDALFR